LKYINKNTGTTEDVKMLSGEDLNIQIETQHYQQLLHHKINP